MKILITGALGHIGSRLIRSLSPDQYEEACLLDNLATQRYSSLFNLPPGIRYRFIEGDVCKADLTELLCGYDIVVHLAAITDAVSSFENAEAVEQVNYIGTERIAAACVRNSCRLVFPSTTSVYGTQMELVDEECPEESLKPQSPYAESKLKAERLLAQLGEDDGLRYTICRFGTIFGTSIGMRFHTAINKFIWQACMGQPITVWRTALHQRRPYLDLSDAVRAVEHIIAHNLFSRQIYNVLTMNATVGEIVEALRDHIPGIGVEYVDSRIMNQLSYHVSSDKFEKTGFKYMGDLHAAIADTVRMFAGIRNR